MQNRLVRHRDMQRVAIRLGIDRDRRDPHPPRGPDDPTGDLAPIGDEDLCKHTDVIRGRRAGGQGGGGPTHRALRWPPCPRVTFTELRRCDPHFVYVDRA